MRARESFNVPPRIEQDVRRASRLEWITIAYMTSCVVVVFLTMGQSQAMKAVWVEDFLGLIPPIAFLISIRISRREPTERFPYGYHRSVTIAYLCAAVALLAVGALIFYDSVHTLISREHPTIGTVQILGSPIWLGWLMYAAILYTSAGSLVLGRMKKSLAESIYDKTLAADCEMNRADWMTGLASSVGITGIALGWWWADAIAALFISFDIVLDGWKNVKSAVRILMDEAPEEAMTDHVGHFAERLRAATLKLHWVTDCEVRLRSEGHPFTGEVFVIPRKDMEDVISLLPEVEALAVELDWRFYDLVIMPVRDFRD